MKENNTNINETENTEIIDSTKPKVGYLKRLLK